MPGVFGRLRSRATTVGGRAARRALKTAGRSVRQSRRAWWLLREETCLPADLWPPISAAEQDDALPLTRRALPLPPHPPLESWLWGEAPISLDGADRSAPRIALLIQPVPPAAARRGDGRPAVPAFCDHDATTLLRDRGASTAPAQTGTLVLTAPGTAPDLRASLGRGRRLGMAGPIVHVLEQPPVEHRAALLGTVSALVVPRGALRNPTTFTSADVAGEWDPRLDWIALAEAAGIPVLEHDPLAPLPVELPSATGLRDRSRQVRLRADRRAGDQGGPLAFDREPAAARPSVDVVREPRRVVVAGHDLKFAGPIISALEAEGHPVRVDTWGGHERHDRDLSSSLTDWADVVFCEWTLGNAVWYSRHLPPRTRLVSRLHLQEAATTFPGRLRTDRLDRLVVVAEHVRRQVVRDHGIPEHLTTVVPNAVRMPPKDRPAGLDPDQRRFRLGLVGMAPSRKGLGAALDLLAALRTVEPRFSLHLKGKDPREIDWVRGRPAELAEVERQFGRMRAEPLLRSAVHLEGFSPDLDAWYDGIGVALSTSDFESFHFTVPDGAAHGCVPRSLAWPGADLLYPTSWLAADTPALAESILDVASDVRLWQETAAQAHHLVATNYAADHVIPRLVGEILGDQPTA